ncbi:hypothetical protein LX15_000165 [Streptoalloteichus tenebrarius]|uniref:Uncharacterized protein n=1 Tax=Streptoalloteichus tenebrarius (strain ATCC 17920 / DSM 40477 / JCM 4838 / CBS 697.72 / NBRC 16177 / NCIMB 11028 / NRRL B-12390 / A12253. 1 / ISP 5477) TaxID=1933 RepID=A0ABT1HLT0_STRSD|nr:hypothetical protein [Streptoalloteichus tenebrarius]
MLRRQRRGTSDSSLPRSLVTAVAPRLSRAASRRCRTGPPERPTTVPEE